MRKVNNYIRLNNRLIRSGCALAIAAYILLHSAASERYSVERDRRLGAGASRKPFCGNAQKDIKDLGVAPAGIFSKTITFFSRRRAVRGARHLASIPNAVWNLQ